MTFKEGAKVVRKESERVYPWFEGNIVLTVRKIVPSVRKVRFYELEGYWNLDKFEIYDKEFSDNEWE